MVRKYVPVQTSCILQKEPSKRFIYVSFNDMLLCPVAQHKIWLKIRWEIHLHYFLDCEVIKKKPLAHLQLFPMNT